jgi:hypothetical protein
VTIDDRGRPAEGERLEAGLERLRRSAAVRGLEERRRKRGPMAVGFAALDTSTQAFSGAHGNTDVHQRPTRVRINEGLFVSTHGFIETLAHELYGHGILLGEALALDLDVGHTIHNEGFALAVGMVAALEAGATVVEEPRLDALAVSTGAYAAEILFNDSKEKRIEFTLAEARDPRGAIAARRKELARRRLSVDGRRRESWVWRWRLEHFEKVHRVDPRALEDMRASVNGTLDSVLPEQRALLDAAEPHLKEVAAWLKGPEGRAFTAGMVAVSTSPYMRALDAELAALGRRIAALRASPPPAELSPAAAPGAPAVEQIGWDALGDMCDRDRVENPDHWKRAPEAGGQAALPWLAK